MDDVYELFQRGTALLESGDFNQAIVPLRKAAAIEPEKTSVREALGRAYFRSCHFEEAAVEFQAVVERARHHLALASNLRPERRDYRLYRDRLRQAS